MTEGSICPCLFRLHVRYCISITYTCQELFSRRRGLGEDLVGIKKGRPNEASLFICLLSVLSSASRRGLRPGRRRRDGPFRRHRRSRRHPARGEAGPHSR